MKNIVATVTAFVLVFAPLSRDNALARSYGQQSSTEDFSLVNTKQNNRPRVMWNMQDVQMDFNILSHQFIQDRMQMPNGTILVPTAQFVLQARNSIPLILGYWAAAYDENGVEIGLMPAEMYPGVPSVEPGDKVYLKVRVGAFQNPEAIRTIVVKRM